MGYREMEGRSMPKVQRPDPMEMVVVQGIYCMLCEAPFPPDDMKKLGKTILCAACHAANVDRIKR